MMKKAKEKKEAIRLRKKGSTYAEILSVIPVAKSTLSLWLREVGLAKKQKQRITEIKIAAAKRGGEAKKKQRIDRYDQIVESVKNDVQYLSQRELFLIGVALYWAEGAKEKEYRPGSGFQFGNMDPGMIKLMIAWLLRVCKIEKSVLVFELYLHKDHMQRVKAVQSYWSKVLDVPVGYLSRIYMKRVKNASTNRKNIGEGYYGLLRIRVPQSSELVRKIHGWSQSIMHSSIK